MVGATLTASALPAAGMIDDDGWIRALMDEAENERMPLMTFVEIARPDRLRAGWCCSRRAAFYIGYFGLYLASRRTAHRTGGAISRKRRC